MPEDSMDTSEIPADETRLLSGAEHRMALGMWVLGAAGVVVCWGWQGWRWGAGFAIGAALSGLNFHWMKSATKAVSDLASQPATSAVGESPERPGSAGVVVRFVLRYALIGVAAYAIFKSSFVSLGAFFAGLFLFLGAILVEVAYEVYHAFRRA